MTDLIEVKTADLAGEALNWSVAIAVSLNPFVSPAQYGVPARVFIQQEGMFPARYKPGVDWAQGGPLMDEHCKGFGLVQDGSASRWRSFAYKGLPEMQRLAGGETILIAACRAIVTVELGDTVQVPKELLS